MAQEILTILNVETGNAVKTVGELRQNIKTLQKTLNDAEVGSKEYTDTLDSLTKNQRALKEVLNASTRSFEDIRNSGDLLSGTYNDLVNRMADIKRAQKEVDVSNADGMKVYAQMAESINTINDRLKDLDAQNGNYQRNVGNYANSMSQAFKSVGGAAGSAIAPIQNMNMGLKAMSANPIMMALTILAGLINGVVKGFQSSETAMNKLAPVMGILNNATTGLTKVFQQLANWIGDAVQWVTKLADKLGLLSDATKENIALVEEENTLNIRRREINEENAKIDQQIADLRAKATRTDLYSNKEIAKMNEEMIALTKKRSANNVELAQKELEIAKRKSALADNSKKENDELSAAEVNYTKALAEADNATLRFNSRLASLNGTTKETKKELSELEKVILAVAEAEQKEESSQQKFLEELKKSNEKTTDGIAEELSKSFVSDGNDIMDDLDEYLSEMEKREAESVERRKAKQEGYKDSVVTLVGSLADMYEELADDDAESQRKVKGIRIASATIETLHGAISAFMKAQETYTPPAGQIIGAVNAAAVLATGMAQIAKIRNTNISASSSTSSSSLATSSYSVSAPSVDTGYTQVRNVISASTEDRLNQATSSQKVYILSSDIEASQNSRKAIVAETSF